MLKLFTKSIISIMAWCVIPTIVHAAPAGERLNEFLQTIREGNLSGASAILGNGGENIKAILIESYGLKKSALEGENCPNVIDSLLLDSIRFQIKGLKGSVDNTLLNIRRQCPKQFLGLPFLYESEPMNDTNEGHPITSTLSSFLEDLNLAVNEFRVAEQNRINLANAKVQEEDRIREEKNQAVEAERTRENESREAKKRMSEEQQIACLKSDKQTLYLHEMFIVDAKERIVNAKKAIENDKRAEEISGVINLALRSKAGTTIIKNEDIIKDSFKEYKALGGTASSPDEITEAIGPC